MTAKIFAAKRTGELLREQTRTISRYWSRLALSSSDLKSSYTGLPDGHVAFPVAEDESLPVLSSCVLVKTEPDCVGGNLVLLRDLMDAEVFLGRIVDAGRQVHNWLRLRIQSTAALIDTASAAWQALSNAVLHDCWRHVWKKGKADYLLVLADLLGICPNLPGDADVRCLQLPALDSGCRVRKARSMSASKAATSFLGLSQKPNVIKF